MLITNLSYEIYSITVILPVIFISVYFHSTKLSTLGLFPWSAWARSSIRRDSRDTWRNETGHMCYSLYWQGLKKNFVMDTDLDGNAMSKFGSNYYYGYMHHLQKEMFRSVLPNVYKHLLNCVHIYILRDMPMLEYSMRVNVDVDRPMESMVHLLTALCNVPGIMIKQTMVYVVEPGPTPLFPRG